MRETEVETTHGAKVPVIEANNERGTHMNNLLELEWRETPTRLIGIASDVWEELQAELENDPPCRCEDCRRMPC